jgi:gluconate:H+ symporter, GntP family
MQNSFIQVISFLIAGIAVIVLLTAKYRLHAFFALLIASFVVGLGIQMPVADIISTTKEGFGNIMKSLGLIIILGTALGVLLEHTGSTKTMAAFILKQTGERHAALAMSITGFIVGLPIFCDSGYIVLSGLNKSMAKRTGIATAIMSTSLATGLYAVHCLLPPHPGAASAAVTIGVDFGKLIIVGIIAAIPAMLAGHWWAKYAGKKIAATTVIETAPVTSVEKLPSVINSFLPVIVPILLIAIKSFLPAQSTGVSVLTKLFISLGDPVIALTIGALLAFNCGRGWTRDSVSKLLQEAAEKAGGILVIIGAGGAFGAILSAAKIGQHFGAAVPLGSLGILFPFLLAVVLKTAQGSSTVAIITAATIVQPLLPALGLTGDNDKLLCVLAMGAGSMMLSHANDAYFWVIAKFSGLEMKTMLKVYSVATALMGVVTLLMLYLIALFLK